MAMEDHVEYALWPQEIVQHFRHKKHNKMKLKDAQQIQREAMQEHPDVIQDPREWIHPSTTITEIPQLKLHQNGFKCQVDAATCQAIRQTKGAMRVHCSEVHGRTTHSERGRPTKASPGKLRPME
ncbi:hypothetical protein LTR56_026751 [Elasticomyces elasticus]|nr:hypothetical protein LTR56_026751 [Elasticomyces elasticus]KAK4900187.1 hypothetical protein LTR49_027493 [Elasticomyces elasticus]KAK5736595.1 hypothetical protein LTS12_026131 [Elasticomyces elasticus]